ncbi:hypothetical protein AKJ56_00900 [candidate division MSBL1 archaeon SCGC-AAA382N08]|uniref:AAA+ ATPase domain-containing protein n=1 Tax=candidate division MSBL1 archaeon SCGC-AAA382N08 TaxID=1698285 RepID=A0A133VQ61_9EURY|nr:hypothetical protein AKJ56_00900 [candidate division MSBL1 archaeon SCGC-AAA382N08]
MIQENNNILLGGSKKGGTDKDWHLFVGNASNKDNERVELDSVSPHVIFVCGARGSGKSYTLGVIAEEIAQSESDVAAVIVDPVGIFWSMKYPNKEEKEKEVLKKINKKPDGIKNVNVFVPTGHTSEIPEETFDTGFSFKPSSLTAEDWCLTFGMDRYSPQGLLLERAIEKVKKGYTRELGDRLEGGSRDVPSNDNFSIDDLLDGINHDRELLSKEKGFKSSTRRALSSRLSTAKDWGIFGREKKLSDLIKPGMISVIDISFLPENIGALVLGLLSRKIFSARKAAAREEAVQDLKNEENRRKNQIPPTWLMVDEAHSFAPSSGKTAATDPLVEYVKQGRRPGLSAVLSTQQPSALNSKIISQVDILFSHRLSFENDIKEVWKRMPTTLPDEIKDPDTLKKLPKGTAIAGDRKVDKAFFLSVRPRISQHEGRERVTNSSLDYEEGSEQEMQEVENLDEYDVQEESEEVGVGQKQINGVELNVVPFQINIEEATEISKTKREKFLRIFWTKEKVRKIYGHYYPIWSFLIDYYPKSKESINLRIQVDALTGELIKKSDGGLERTCGVRDLVGLTFSEREIFFEILEEDSLSYEDLEDLVNHGGSEVRKCVSTLIDEGFLEESEEENETFLNVKEPIDVPTTLSGESLLAAEEIPEPEEKRMSPDKKEDRIVNKEKVLETLKMFGEIEVIENKLLYYPYWIAELVNDDEKRIIAIDGVHGKKDTYATRMLRRRV